MVPRGEVGLIFAQMGLATGAIGADLFGAIMLMVLVTTLVTPPLLGRVAARLPAASSPTGRARAASMIWSRERDNALPTARSSSRCRQRAGRSPDLEERSPMD